MANARRYSVYHIKTEMPLVIYGTSKECAEAMGVTLNSFYRYLMRIREGKIQVRKWLIYEDEVEGLEEDVEVQEAPTEPIVEKMPELKPCPFCGSEPYIQNRPTERKTKIYSVKCHCGAMHKFKDRRYKAIEAWNRRVEDGKGNP